MIRQTPTLPYASDYQASREYCRQVTREQARNFYYGLRLLPEPTKSSMFALYAWMRQADDLADAATTSPLAQRRALLDQFRSLTHQAITGTAVATNDHAPWPGWTAFTDCVLRHHIPAHLFDAMIDGQKQDLEFHQPETDADLREYCYRVAGVVGVASIHIWGYTGGTETETLAVDRGIAFQLTNILRDIREDASRARIYFPQERMRRVGATATDVFAGKNTAGFQTLIKYYVDLAEELFARSAPLEQRINAENISALRAMTAIYHGLLLKIAQNPQRVLRSRVRLGKLAKTWIALQCWQASRR
ncbi:MAG: phytoene/squalene synthase family protein [Phycisphaerae bacterium]